MTVTITYTGDDIAHLISEDLARRKFTVFEQEIKDQVSYRIYDDISVTLPKEEA